MSFYNDAFPDASQTEEDILDDLRVLAGYYENLGIYSTLLPALAEAPLPTLVVYLPEEDGTQARTVTHNLMPLGAEQVKDTKFLQFYCDIDVDISSIERVTLLEAILRMGSVNVCGSGHLLPHHSGEGEKVAVRFMQGFPINETIDYDLFVDMMTLFDVSCHYMTQLMIALVDGTSLDDAFASLEMA